MSFKKTGKIELVERQESLMHCDFCDALISIDAYKSKPHFSLDTECGFSHQDVENYHLCSVACLASFASTDFVHWVPKSPEPLAPSPQTR